MNEAIRNQTLHVQPFFGRAKLQKKLLKTEKFVKIMSNVSIFGAHRVPPVWLSLAPYFTASAQIGITLLQSEACGLPDGGRTDGEWRHMGACEWGRGATLSLFNVVVGFGRWSADNACFDLRFTRRECQNLTRINDF